MTQKLTKEFIVKAEDAGNLCDLLHRQSALSKVKIKEALKCGACRIQKKDSKVKKRTRKAKTIVQGGDHLSFHYDPEILALQLPPPELIHDCTRYTVWDKPAGMLSQGTQFADHCSMLRQVELLYERKRQVYLVHRLDREASGLFLVAHDKKTAAQFSLLFQNRLVQKKYLIEVLGNIADGSSGQTGQISSKLDGKPAETTYSVLSYSPATNSSKLLVQINSGRFHQIRRHFASIHHPVMGDPRYGVGNKNKEGLRLRAVILSFVCPISRKFVEYHLVP